MYDRIKKIIAKVISDENLFFIGGLSADVVENNIQILTGKYGLENLNESKESLIDFCSKHELIITNTGFNQQPRRR